MLDFSLKHRQHKQNEHDRRLLDDEVTAARVPKNVWSSETTTRNIKVFVRFRPFSFLEKELINTGVGG